MNLCLLIINYNGLRYLERYLKGISEACNRNNITLIVTDSGSSDGSLQYLADHAYQYTVTLEPAKGFANNVNHGIQYAMCVSSFDYFIISNNDIEVSGELFPVLKSTLKMINEKFPDNGIIGFDEVLVDRADYFKAFSYSGYESSAVKKVNDIPGFFMIIRKEVIENIGLFDEEYFMYGEDNDFFTRAKKAGFGIYNTFLPVLHYSEGSSADSKKTSWYVYRNAFLYAQKNLGFTGSMKMFLSFINQIYNPFFKDKNAGNARVTRNGFFYNNYLLAKSLAWNIRYFLKRKFSGKKAG